MSKRRRQQWHAQTAAESVAPWKTDLTSGHTRARATALLAEVGPNALKEKPPPSLLKRLFDQIADVTVLALLAAALIAAIVGFVEHTAESTFVASYGDSLAILAIVILNAVLGVVQEKKAEKALAALRSMTSPTARVLRGGQVVDVAASDVVPGDVLQLKEGDKVPADARVLSQSNLEATESALTGESFPVDKDAIDSLARDTPLAERRNMLYMGTEISQGRGRAVVVSTGMDTELGQIAGMLATMETEDTPLQRYLNRFGQQIVIACVLVSAIVFAAGFIRGAQTLRELFLTAVSLAVAAIPEGLPAITTIVLALGTQRMAKRHALVRRLPAVEGLGSAQIICTDKTGTLTQNMMTVRRLHAGGVTYVVGGEGRTASGDFAPEKGAAVDPSSVAPLYAVLEDAAWAPDARAVRNGEALDVAGNPTDGALLVAAIKGGHDPSTATPVHEIPFSSSRKMATQVIATDAGPRAMVRGAPDILIERCTSELTADGVVPLDAAGRKRWIDTADSWAGAAMRVVAMARRENEPQDAAEWEYELTIVGLLGIVDPVRPEVGAAIAEARAAGIHTLMITGDHPETARAIGEQLGLIEHSSNLLTGQQLDMLDQAALEERVDTLSIVARATPLHKLRIVEALKSRGRVCAMTGDGVNDAPAVKAASIGVAMGQAGTEVTKEAADLVLSDDNYATIVHAVEEGRSIFINIKKFIFFLLSSNTGIVLAVFAAGLLGWAPLLLPIQILWINLVTNGLPALALGVDPPEPGLMDAPPRDPKAQILGKAEYRGMLFVGTVMAVASMVAFWWVIGDPMDASSNKLRQAQTAAFGVLAISPMFHAFNCRSALVSNFELGWFTNRALWGSVFVGVALMALAVYVPAMRTIFRTEALTNAQLGMVIALSAAPLLLYEPYKLLLGGTQKGK